jgi:hypothetical protein
MSARKSYLPLLRQAELHCRGIKIAAAPNDTAPALFELLWVKCTTQAFGVIVLALFPNVAVHVVQQLLMSCFEGPTTDSALLDKA